MASPQLSFRHSEYVRINEARMTHLWSLDLPIPGKSVLELGAGIGDLTHELREKKCRVTCVDGRQENLSVIKSRFPYARGVAMPTLVHLNLNDPPVVIDSTHDVGFVYGLLYHLRAASLSSVIRYCALKVRDLAVFETVVSLSADPAGRAEVETDPDSPTQSLDGESCRPLRGWLWAELAEHFGHVYVPRTQPKHEEFPVDWSKANPGLRQRAIFVASHKPLDNPKLSSELLTTYEPW